MRPRPLAAASSTLLAGLLLVGCDRDGGTNAGLTNGPPPTASEKPAGRTDLPASAAPDSGERLGQAGDEHTNAGVGAHGVPADAKTDDSASADRVRANPPAKGSSDASSAAGGTKPAGTIKVGTPRSPN